MYVLNNIYGQHSRKERNSGIDFFTSLVIIIIIIIIIIITLLYTELKKVIVSCCPSVASESNDSKFE